MQKFLTLLCVSAIGTTAMAQLSIGAKAGLNYTIISTSIDPEPDEDPESANGIGYHFGGFFQYNFSDMIALRPEVLYSSRGFQEEDNSTDSFDAFGTTTTTETKYENKSSYSYLEVPILLAIHPSENFAIHVGPGFGLLMGGKVKSSGEITTTVDDGTPETTTTSFDEEYSGSDVTDDLNSLEIGGIIGLGYQTDGGFGFNLRYWRGLNTVNEETEFGDTTYKQFTNMLQLSVSYAFFHE